MIRCDFCKKELTDDEFFWDLEHPELYQELRYNIATYKCKQCGEKIAQLVEQMKAMNINPVIDPYIPLEMVHIEDKAYKQYRGEPVSKYDSDYASFALTKKAAEARKSAIDAIDKLNDEKLKRIARKLIECIDGLIAEALMGRDITNGTWTNVVVYQVAAIFIEDYLKEMTEP